MTAALAGAPKAADPAPFDEAPVVQASVVQASFMRAPARPRSLLQDLLDVPSRFSFDAAVAVMMRASGQGDPGAAIRFQAPAGLAFASADMLAVRPSPDGFTATPGMIGLTGPAGVLPRPYTEIANSEHRQRSAALAAFLDMLAQRPIAQFAAAGIKYRPHRAADVAALGPAGSTRPQDGLRNALLALTGYADPGLLARLQTGADPLLFYAGAFAARPRSADRLAALLSDWLGQRVEIEQFAGTWLELGRDQMTALPRNGAGQFNQLGVDAAAGARAWDVQSRIVLRIGPLGLAAFKALSPGGALLARLASLARAYLGGEVGFAFNPVLAAHAVPQAVLGPAAPCQLGWTSWLPVGGGRREDAADAKFTAGNAEQERRTT